MSGAPCLRAKAYEEVSTIQEFKTGIYTITFYTVGRYIRSHWYSRVLLLGTGTDLAFDCPVLPSSIA